MDRRLVDVCQAGNIEAFDALLEDEPYNLDYIDRVPYTRTPLHIAVLARKNEFAKEIASLRPSFITKIDRYGYSPIHLAAENGQVEMVRCLLEKLGPKNEHIIIRGGKEHRTPLHVAVISGQIEVVKFLIEYNPRCIMDLTVRNETTLHLAVKNKQLSALLLLLEHMKLAAVKETSYAGVNNELLNCKDEEGNTILHLATMMQQLQIVEALLKNCTNSAEILQVDVNALNGKNCTALDLLMQFPVEKRDVNIEKMLRQAQSKQTSSGSTI